MRNSGEEFFLRPCYKQLFHLTKSAVNQIAKTVQTRNENNLFGNGMVVLGLSTSHFRNEMKIAGTSMIVPIDITDDTLASSLVPVQCASLAPPALFKKGEEGRKKKEVLHLSRCHTHTHTAEPGKP